jgi:hypothetical protein
MVTQASALLTYQARRVTRRAFFVLTTHQEDWMRENPTKKKQVSDRFLSLTEVGAILRLTDTEIQAWIASGELPTVSYQGSNIISEAELNEFLDRIRRSGRSLHAQEKGAGKEI